MSDFKPGDKVRMIGDPDFTGTVTAVGQCDDTAAFTDNERCDETMVTFEDEHGQHSTHAADLEPADG